MMDFRRMWVRTLGLATVVLFSFCSDVETAISQEASAVAAVPKGEIKGPFRWESQIFPGTVRNFWLYVPAQYDGQTPACVMVVQDGLQLARRWKLIEAWDRLIANGEIPVQIGIMIEPGVVPAPHEDAQPRFNRSFEYDGLGDQYARFLVEEILPEVGQDYSLSNRPGDRAIAGSSSGGICAFNAAWERPDQFGPTSDCEGEMNIPSWFAKLSPSHFVFFFRTVIRIRISTGATGGSATSRCFRLWNSAATRSSTCGAKEGTIANTLLKS